MVLIGRAKTAILFGAVLAIGVGACQGRPTPSVAPSSSPAPSQLPGTSQQVGTSAEPSTIAPYPIRSLAGLRVVTMPLPTGFRVHRMASDGTRIVFDELGYGDDSHKLGRTIYLADAADGSVRPLAQGAGGYSARDAAISGDVVAWVEWRYPEDNAFFRGPVDWRILTYDLTTARGKVIASGTNRMERGGAATPPLVHVDGRRIAYDVEDPTVARPDGWKIVVQDLDSGATLWSVSTRRWLYQFALSGERVAWSEGAVDPNIGVSYDTSLWLSDHGATPTMVASDAFELALSGTTLAWVADPGSSQTDNGLAEHPTVWETDTRHLEPVQLSAPIGPLVKASSWVAAGDGVVTWADNEYTGVGTSSGIHLAAWTRSTGSFGIEPTNAITQGVGGGWLIWYDDNIPDSPVFHGVELSTLLPGGVTP